MPAWHHGAHNAHKINWLLISWDINGFSCGDTVHPWPEGKFKIIALFLTCFKCKSNCLLDFGVFRSSPYLDRPFWTVCALFVPSCFCFPSASACALIWCHELLFIPVCVYHKHVCVYSYQVFPFCPCVFLYLPCTSPQLLMIKWWVLASCSLLVFCYRLLSWVCLPALFQATLSSLPLVVWKQDKAKADCLPYN